MSYEDGKKLKIFTGNANPKLAKEIADYLAWNLARPSSASSTTAKSKS